MKIIFVTGGVVSGIGKGISAASIGALLANQGLKINVQKLDPYINIDPGTMNPVEHGEVYVTQDGLETDLDLGHYERFIPDLVLDRNCSHTSGKIYQEVLSNERKGLYNGHTVQVIPHITEEIKRRIKKSTKNCDVLIVEIGGTVGDIESQPYLESIRQLKYEMDKTNDQILIVHTTLVPYLKVSKESKTKPTQQSTNLLKSYGLQPDFLILRTEVPLTDNILQKVSNFCNVPRDHVISAEDESTIYNVPVRFFEQVLCVKICNKFNYEFDTSKVPPLKKYVDLIKNAKINQKIAIVGKYTQLEDAYKSVIESIEHAAYSQNVKPEITLINSENITKENVKQILEEYAAVIVPGGFGQRATKGIIETITYVRENKKPFLGICYGMQLATIEYAKNVLKIEDPNSFEINPNAKNFIFHLLPGKNQEDIGGTLRLGTYEAQLNSNTKIAKAYAKNNIFERHRHRYEFNNEYLNIFENDSNFIISGKNPQIGVVETIELKDHPYFIAVQYHPEFKSKPLIPHPLFVGLIKSIENMVK